MAHMLNNVLAAVFALDDDEFILYPEVEETFKACKAVVTYFKHAGLQNKLKVAILVAVIMV